MKCQLNTDRWEDAGVTYTVYSYARRNINSTAVEMCLESPDGNVVTRVVPLNQIEWIEDEN